MLGWKAKSNSASVFTAAVAQHDLGMQELHEGLAGGGPAVVDLREDAVDGLEGTGHLQIGEHRPHAVAPAHRGHRHCTSAAYSCSRRRCTGTAGRGRGAGRAVLPAGRVRGPRSGRRDVRRRCRAGGRWRCRPPSAPPAR